MNAEHEWYRQHQVFLRNVMENAWSRRDPRVLAARTRRPASNETASLKALWQAHHLYYGVPQAWWDFTTGNRNGGLAGNVTQGRCRSCNVVIQWVPKCCVVKLVRDAYCPRCGTKLDRTTHLADVEFVYEAPVAKPREVA